MRTAPIGFTNIFAKSLEETFTLASDSARVSHGHPSGYLSAGSAGHDHRPYCRGPTAIRCSYHFSGDHGRSGRVGGEVCSAIRAAVDLSSTSGWRDRLPELGGGWVRRGSPGPSGVLCSLAGASRLKVGDCRCGEPCRGFKTPTGAITGNIVGAMHGPSDVAKPLGRAARVARCMIEILATDLADVLEAKASPEALYERYPGS